MKPTADKILILADKPKNRTESGLYIQEDWKSLPLTGVVKAIGPDVTLVKKGDRVMFERYASIVLEEDQRLCKEDHIFGVFDA